jgi:hypothetical protein
MMSAMFKMLDAATPPSPQPTNTSQHLTTLEGRCAHTILHDVLFNTFASVLSSRYRWLHMGTISDSLSRFVLGVMKSNLSIVLPFFLLRYAFSTLYIDCVALIAYDVTPDTSDCIGTDNLSDEMVAFLMRRDEGKASLRQLLDRIILSTKYDLNKALELKQVMKSVPNSSLLSSLFSSLSRDVAGFGENRLKLRRSLKPNVHKCVQSPSCN